MDSETLKAQAAFTDWAKKAAESWKRGVPPKSLPYPRYCPECQEMMYKLMCQMAAEMN